MKRIATLALAMAGFWSSAAQADVAALICPAPAINDPSYAVHVSIDLAGATVQTWRTGVTEPEPKKLSYSAQITDDEVRWVEDFGNGNINNWRLDRSTGQLTNAYRNYIGATGVLSYSCAKQDKVF